MNRGSLCAIVALNAAACVSQKAYTPPSDVITRYITIPQSCPAPETIVERLPCEQKIEEQKPDSITPEYRALLDTIAWAEGTDCHYNMMVGRMLFTNYASHPIETGEMPEKGVPFKTRGRKYWRIIYSTAAGRYQFLYRTYKTLKADGFFQTGFSPEEQDKAGKYLIEKQGVTQETLEQAIQEKNSAKQQKEFIEIWHTLSGTWASLPHKKTKRSRYWSQFANKQEDLQKIFFIYYDQYKK